MLFPVSLVPKCPGVQWGVCAVHGRMWEAGWCEVWVAVCPFCPPLSSVRCPHSSWPCFLAQCYMVMQLCSDDHCSTKGSVSLLTAGAFRWDPCAFDFLCVTHLAESVIYVCIDSIAPRKINWLISAGNSCCPFLLLSPPCSCSPLLAPALPSSLLLSPPRRDLRPGLTRCIMKRVTKQDVYICCLYFNKLFIVGLLAQWLQSSNDWMVYFVFRKEDELIKTGSAY
jgi:hypothetical protein